jgi:hypothetical protein
LVAKVANRAAQPSRVSRGAPTIKSTTPRTSPRQVPIYQLRPGDCVDSPPAANVTVRYLPVVPCGQPHDQEVIATRDLGPGPWPGDAAVKARSNNGCALEFAIYVGLRRVTPVTTLGGMACTKTHGRVATARYSAWSPIRAARQPARCAAPTAELVKRTEAIAGERRAVAVVGQGRCRLSWSLKPPVAGVSRPLPDRCVAR